MNSFNNLNNYGLFENVFLEEITYVGQRFKNKIDLNIAHDDIKNFLQELESIATKNLGEDVPLDYRGKFINTRIILVAKFKKIVRKGYDPYVYRLQEAKDNNIESVYVIITKKSKIFADPLFKEVEKQMQLKPLWKKDIKINTYQKDNHKIIALFRF